MISAWLTLWNGGRIQAITFASSRNRARYMFLCELRNSMGHPHAQYTSIRALKKPEYHRLGKGRERVLIIWNDLRQVQPRTCNKE